MPRHTRAVKHKASGSYLGSSFGFNASTSVVPTPCVSLDSHLWVIEPSTDGRGCTLCNLDTGRFLDVVNNTVVGSSSLTAGCSWAVEVGEDRAVFFRHLLSGSYLTLSNNNFALTSQRTDLTAFVYEDVEIRCIKPGSAVYAILTKDPARGIVVEIENRASFVLKLRADYGGCRNLSVAATAGKLESDRIATITVPPLSRCGFVQLSVLSTPWRWGWVCAWAWAPPPPSAIAELAIAAEATSRAEIQAVERLVKQRAGETTEPVEVLCGRRGVRFVDVAFPPDASSLFPPGVRDIDRGGIPFVWLRPSALVAAGDGESGLFKGPTCGADVRPGTLGDLWLTSALAVIADRSGVVEGLLSRTDAATMTAGVLRGKLCVDGWWCVVTTDTCVPCHPGKGIAFAHARHGLLWVSAMQKIFAKVYRGYHSLCSGSFAHAIEDVTGLPVAQWSVPATDHEAMWGALVAAVGGGHPVAAVTPGSEASPYTGDGDVEYELPPALKDRYAAHGFEAARGYAVLDCRVVQSDSFEAQIGSWQARVVKLRNPSPRFGWVGPFSNASPLWTPTLREELGVNAADDGGTFWMDYGSFVESFASVSIGRWAPGLRDVRAKGQFMTGGLADCMLSVTMSGATNLVACVQQPDLRRRGPASRYLEIGVLVLEPFRRPQTRTLVYRAAAFSGLLKQRTVHVSVPVTASAVEDPWYILPVTFRTPAAPATPMVVTAAASLPFKTYRALVPDDRTLRAALCAWTRVSGKPRALDQGCTVWFDLTSRLANFELRNVTEKVLNFGLDLTKCVGLVSDAPDGRMKFLVEVPPRSSVPVASLLAVEPTWRVAWRFMWRFLPPRADAPPLEALVDEGDVIYDLAALPTAGTQVQADGAAD